MSARHRVTTLVLSLGLFLALADQVQAQTGGMEGVVKDTEGNPMVGITVEIIRTDISGKYEVKTNDKGYYIYMGLPAGGATYDVHVIQDGQQLFQLGGIRVSTGDIRKVDIDLQKERQMRQQQLTEEQKRQIEEQRKGMQDFQSMKENYELGMALLREPSADVVCSARCPQEGPDAAACMSDCQAQANGGQLQQMAHADAAAALQRASEIDPNQVAVWANLARAYGMTGEDEKGIEAYKKAIELSPEEAGLYNNLGQLYVKLNRLDEAQQAFTKAAELNPEQAGAFFYNLGVTFYNAGNVAAAIEPFRKATEIDPTRADAFYLLGVCLYGQAEFKQEGDQMITVLKPGTRESFEHYLELEPNGKSAEMAKQYLQAIEATIPTSINVKK